MSAAQHLHYSYISLRTVAAAANAAAAAAEAA